MERLKVFVNDKHGEVSGEVAHKSDCTHLMVLAHGAGANMDHRFMVGLARALLSTNIASLRFNFPYMEQGRRRPDRKSVTIDTFLAVTEAAKRFQLPLILGGKSFGGRMASHVVSMHKDLSVQGLIFFGFPLHAPGRPSIERAAHIPTIEKPMLFLQGTRDSLANLELLEEAIKGNHHARLVVLEGADHSFKFLKRMEISEEEMFNILSENVRIFLDH